MCENYFSSLNRDSIEIPTILASIGLPVFRVRPVKFQHLGRKIIYYRRCSMFSYFYYFFTHYIAYKQQLAIAEQIKLIAKDMADAEQILRKIYRRVEKFNGENAENNEQLNNQLEVRRIWIDCYKQRVLEILEGIWKELSLFQNTRCIFFDCLRASVMSLSQAFQSLEAEVNSINQSIEAYDQLVEEANKAHHKGNKELQNKIQKSIDYWDSEIFGCIEAAQEHRVSLLIRHLHGNHPDYSMFEERDVLLLTKVSNDAIIKEKMCELMRQLNEVDGESDDEKLADLSNFYTFLLERMLQHNSGKPVDRRVVHEALIILMANDYNMWKKHVESLLSIIYKKEDLINEQLMADPSNSDLLSQLAVLTGCATCSIASFDMAIRALPNVLL